MDNEQLGVEHIDGPTPNGDYAIAYLSCDGKPCSKADATDIEIHEFLKDGTPTMRTYLKKDPAKTH